MRRTKAAITDRATSNAQALGILPNTPRSTTPFAIWVLMQRMHSTSPRTRKS